MTLVDTLNQSLRKLPTWPFYAIGLAVPFWYLYLGFNGGLGVEPIKELEHRLGLLGLQVLVAGLLVTPLRRFAGLNLLKFRRMLGLIAFYLIAAHLLTWLVLDVRNLGAIWADIVKRPYITIGMAAFLMLIPLAVTSNNASIRKLGAKGWRRLHMLVYPAVILGAVHFVMLRKGWQVEPLVYLAAFVLLVGMRLIPRSVDLRRRAARA